MIQHSRPYWKGGFSVGILLNYKIDKRFHYIDQSGSIWSDPVNSWLYWWMNWDRPTENPPFQYGRLCCIIALGLSCSTSNLLIRVRYSSRWACPSDQTFDVSIACTRKGDGDFRPFHAKCLGCINTPTHSSPLSESIFTWELMYKVRI